MITFYNTGLPAIIGALAGIAGAFITPLVGWGIEKKRMKVQHHRELIANWRVLLHDVTEAAATAKQTGSLGPPSFINRVKNHPYFPSLLPHLPQATLDLLDNTKGAAWSDNRVQHTYNCLLQNVNEAKRRWDLV